MAAFEDTTFIIHNTQHAQRRSQKLSYQTGTEPANTPS